MTSERTILTEDDEPVIIQYDTINDCIEVLVEEDEEDFYMFLSTDQARVMAHTLLSQCSALEDYRQHGVPRP